MRRATGTSCHGGNQALDLLMAAFSMCSIVAQRNLDNRHAAIVVRDIADSTVHTAVKMATAAVGPVPIEGMTLSIGRPQGHHRRAGAFRRRRMAVRMRDGSCLVQDRPTKDLATLGGWAPNSDARP